MLQIRERLAGEVHLMRYTEHRCRSLLAIPTHRQNRWRGYYRVARTKALEFVRAHLNQGLEYFDLALALVVAPQRKCSSVYLLSAYIYNIIYNAHACAITNAHSLSLTHTHMYMNVYIYNII